MLKVLKIVLTCIVSNGHLVHIVKLLLQKENCKQAMQ